ncbi:hypothetical protein [Breoghania sp.]|uniref:hypothetical protein n=1 Tax=Breoghania sp. TaxID=2065378 RepID=UPI002AA6D7A8|nr:hypothetical protein [Breoghania sp.]
MINAAMYFALGFLTAGLSMLVLGPALWRRAVRLTRRSFEATSPMTLAEARAARDQLRAEYAVKTRRLELGAEGLKERMVRQSLEVTEAREALKAAFLERDSKAAAVRELEEREENLRAELLAKQENIARLSARLRETERTLDERIKQIAEMARAEAVRMEETPVVSGNFTVSIAELEEEISGHKARHTADAAKILRLESEVDALRRELEDKSIEKSSQPLKPRTSADAALKKMEAMILDLESQKVESQAEITRLSLQMEALQGSSGDNLEAVLASLEAENNALAEELNRLSAEHDHLRSRFDAVNAGEEEETRLLRNHITSLAAEIVALTAAIEGEGSPTDAILDGESDRSLNGKGRTGAEESLADRIRTLRKQMREEKASAQSSTKTPAKAPAKTRGRKQRATAS